MVQRLWSQQRLAIYLYFVVHPPVRSVELLVVRVPVFIDLSELTVDETCVRIHFVRCHDLLDRSRHQHVVVVELDEKLTGDNFARASLERADLRNVSRIDDVYSIVTRGRVPTCSVVQNNDPLPIWSRLRAQGRVAVVKELRVVGGREYRDMCHTLGEKDSNPHSRIQSPLSCHWTIPDCVAKGVAGQ